MAPRPRSIAGVVRSIARVVREAPLHKIDSQDHVIYLAGNHHPQCGQFILMNSLALMLLQQDTGPHREWLLSLDSDMRANLIRWVLSCDALGATAEQREFLRLATAGSDDPKEKLHDIVTAAVALLDPLAMTVFDKAHSQGEDRWFTLGRSSDGKLLAVAHTYQSAGSASERVRIISAREATRSEREQYENSLSSGNLIE